MKRGTPTRTGGQQHITSVTLCCSVLQWVAVCCSVLLCVAVCCCVLQRHACEKGGGVSRAKRGKCVLVLQHITGCVAVRCSALKEGQQHVIRVSLCCNLLQCVTCRTCHVSVCVAVGCSALQCVVVRCSALQCVAVHCSALQCVAERCSALQCVAVRCVAVRCSALQGVAVHCVAANDRYILTLRAAAYSVQQNMDMYSHPDVSTHIDI